MVSTVIVGVDAASLPILSAAIEERDLPNFESLVSDSPVKKLESTVPPMTPQAWTTIATGLPPEEHGVHDFREIDPTTYEVTPVSGRLQDTVTTWDMWASDGESVGVVNHPLAYPPCTDYEFFVSGIPNTVDDRIGTPNTVQEHLESINYQTKPKASPSDRQQYLDELIELARTRCQTALKLASNHHPSVLWVVFMLVDWAQHHLWTGESEPSPEVLDAYEVIDEILGKFESQLDPETLVVLSDHGATGIHGEIHLNSVLADLGYLHRAEKTQSTMERVWTGGLAVAYSLLSRLPRSVKTRLKSVLPDSLLSEARYADEAGQSQMHRLIDWERTTAFSFGSMGRLFVNTESRFQHGTVSPDKYDQVVSALIDDLRSVEHPSTGESFVDKVFRSRPSEELTPSRPDIRFETTDWRYMVYGDFGDEAMHEPRHRVADHHRTGIFLAHGPNVAAGGDIDSSDPISILDVAPTILALTDAPVSPGMIGNPDLRLFAESNPSIKRTKLEAEKVNADQSAEHIDSETVEERLDDLGYL